MSKLQTVALRHLRASPLNVRTTNPDEDIERLAESIAANGLRQNLGVVPVEDGRKGVYEVVYGGRRFRALELLLDGARIDLDYAVPVRVEKRSDGREASLEENLERIAMNPADEYRAFRTIVDEHRADEDPLDYVARRFRVPRRHVEQQLRLADLHPEILDALRDGTIDVAAARAYATYGDQELQLAVFQAEERRSFGEKHKPSLIRDTMKGRALPINAPQVIYVGLDEYVAAGGPVERVMFMGADDGERVTDLQLLDKLARAKATEALPALVAADGFVGGLLTQGLTGIHPAWPKVPPGFRPGLPGPPADRAQRAGLIGVYGLEEDGSGLKIEGHFAPLPRAAGSALAPAPSAPPIGAAPEGRPALDEAISYSRIAPGERLARQAEERRRARIRVHAARLAVPELIGPPFDWIRFPEDDLYGALEETEDGAIYVTALIRIDPNDLAAHEAEAEAQLAAEEAAAPAEAAE